MKVYGIFPTFEMVGSNHERTQQCIALITNLVFECMRKNGDNFHAAVEWRDPGKGPGSVFIEDIAEPHVVDLSVAGDLMDRIRRSVDPFDNVGGVIRSIASCRAVTFGYDGQAFICLRHEDEPPISTDTSLAVVEERPDILVDTDYFDGFLRPDIS